MSSQNLFAPAVYSRSTNIYHGSTDVIGPHTITWSDWSDYIFTVYIDGEEYNLDPTDVTSSAGSTITIEMETTDEDVYFPLWCPTKGYATSDTGVLSSSSSKVGGGVYSRYYIISVDSPLPAMGSDPETGMTMYDCAFFGQYYLDYLPYNLFENNPQLIYVGGLVGLAQKSTSSAISASQMSPYILYPCHKNITYVAYMYCNHPSGSAHVCYVPPLISRAQYFMYSYRTSSKQGTAYTASGGTAITAKSYSTISSATTPRCTNTSLGTYEDWLEECKAGYESSGG